MDYIVQTIQNLELMMGEWLVLKILVMFQEIFKIFWLKNVS